MSKRTIALSAVGGIALVALLVVGAMALQSRLDGDDLSTVSAGADEGWIAADSALSRVRDWVSMGDTIYALSTVPGRGVDEIQALYTSRDGETWEQIDHSFGDLKVLSMSSHDDSLYAIGTAPASSAVGWDVALSTSTDGGVTWSNPAFLGAVGQLDDQLVPLLQHSHAEVSVAASEVVVAAVWPAYFIDYTPLIPDALRRDTVTAAPTATGLIAVDLVIADGMIAACRAAAAAEEKAGCDQDIVDMPEARLWEATWDELGIQAPDLGVALFVAEAGAGFEQVADIEQVGDIDVISKTSLVTVDDGFLITVGPKPAEVWSSPDGRRWDRVEGLPFLSQIIEAGQLGDELVIAAYDRSEAPVLLSAETFNGPWTTTLISEALPAVSFPGVFRAAIGRSEMVLGVAGWDEASQTDYALLARSSDGIDWSVFPATEILGQVDTHPANVLVTDDGVIGLLNVHRPEVSSTVMAIGHATED